MPSSTLCAVWLICILLVVFKSVPFVSAFAFVGPSLQLRRLPISSMSLSATTQRLTATFEKAMRVVPKVGSFPVLAEVLRREGVLFNYWYLPSCSSLYRTTYGDLVTQMPPLVTGTHQIAPFNRDALIEAIRADQTGETVFPQFLSDIYAAGVVAYDVDFERRRCVYYGINRAVDFYEESYPAVEVEVPEN